jgi:hypothetical protein
MIYIYSPKACDHLLLFNYERVLVHIFGLLNYFVIGCMAVPNDTHFVHHPRDHGGMGPFPPAEPTPLCYCGLPAFVKQLRHPTSAGRPLYCCQQSVVPQHLMPTYRDAASINGSMGMKCLIP